MNNYPVLNTTNAIAPNIQDNMVNGFNQLSSRKFLVIPKQHIINPILKQAIKYLLGLLMKYNNL